MGNETNYYYVVPKERVANVLTAARFSARHTTSEIVCTHYDAIVTLTDHPVRERIYAGPTLGFVQGFVGTRARVEVEGGEGWDQARKGLEGAKDYLI